MTRKSKNQRLSDLPDGWWMHNAAVHDLCTYLKGHIVGLAVGLQHEGKNKVVVYSGFTIDLGGQLFWITAGHVIEAIEDFVKRRDVRIASSSWVDSFDGPGGKFTIPTSLHDLDSRRGETSDIDLAFVRLNKNDSDLLRANPEFKTFTKASWEGNVRKPEGHYLIGFPVEWQEFFVRPGKERSTVTFSTNLVAAPLLEIVDATQEDQTRTDRFWNHERCIYGRVTLRSAVPGKALDSMRGTSGGPIISVERTDDDRILYKPVGVQSAWLRERQVVRVEPLSTVVAAIESLLPKRRNSFTLRSTTNVRRKSMAEKVVLAYSGGLDTSIIIPWLKENHGLEVHAVCGDVGQGGDELAGLEAKAKKTGAKSCKVVDQRREFLVDYVWPNLRAMSVYEGRYLLGTSMARPILAKAQIEYAREIGAKYVAHGCTGKGNDQVRFELTYMALAPDLEIIAPWRTWDITSREDAIDYAESRKIPITASRTKIYSRDRNLWHISHEGGALEDPANAPPDDVWMLTTNPENAPDVPHVVTVGYEKGVPVSVDGKRLAPEILIAKLNEIGGRHGVGRIDIVENRLVGMKSRGVYETPGGTIVLEGLRTLRSLTLDRDTFRACEKLMPEYADIVYTGRWFAPAREAFDAFFAKATEVVTGEVQIKLFKGSCVAQSATSPFTLYSESLATFGESAAFDHADSKGFVKLYGLPGMVAASVRRANKAGASKSKTVRPAGNSSKSAAPKSSGNQARSPAIAGKGRS